ncbi:hypothetical protein ARMGADRAFT_928956 [Armillaria gallica]|uniref:Uncharacterized protein n=1 Tax=Armillaria gallica TaxID=47427 RepID=A0A2H3DX97_ARMGA|nr:hypothetical protein ARMGADRAFT_928956 [Armillaria gallica]
MFKELVDAQKSSSGDDELTDNIPDDHALVKHHHIALDQRQAVYLHEWLSENRDDPAFKDFLPKLKQHLLSCLRGHSAIREEDEFSPAQLNQISFDQQRIYSHATAHFNYTTYDVCHDQDNIHVGKNGQKRDIMVMSNDEDPESHPFWYARVLGIYHANVLDSGTRFPKPKRMEFLWVC